MKKQTGVFRYKDHYENKPDIIKVTVTQTNLNLLVKTNDCVFKKGEYNFKREDLIDLINSIKRAWDSRLSVEYNKSRKKIKIVIDNAEENVILERGLHMNILINNKCIIYGLNLTDSRRLHQMFAQIINNKISTNLSKT